jgi:hypothetical protein
MPCERAPDSEWCNACARDRSLNVRHVREIAVALAPWLTIGSAELVWKLVEHA